MGLRYPRPKDNRLSGTYYPYSYLPCREIPYPQVLGRQGHTLIREGVGAGYGTFGQNFVTRVPAWRPGLHACGICPSARELSVKLPSPSPKSHCIVWPLQNYFLQSEGLLLSGNLASRPPACPASTARPLPRSAVYSKYITIVLRSSPRPVALCRTTSNHRQTTGEQQQLPEDHRQQGHTLLPSHRVRY